jgi:hypothetical protein
MDEFSNKCRERKFIVRDFIWNAEQLSDEKKKYTELLAAEKDQWVIHLFLLIRCVLGITDPSL